MPKRTDKLLAEATRTSPRRRSHRLQKATSNDKENNDENENETKNVMNNDHYSSESESEDDQNHEEVGYEFEGKFYPTYQEMVNAKRKRNEDYLKENGLWKPLADSTTTTSHKTAQSNGIKKRRVSTTKTNNSQSAFPRRQSKRLAGTPADGRFVESEGGRSFVIVGSGGGGGGANNGERTTVTRTTVTTDAAVPKYQGRVNDGSPISLENAILLCDPKWVQETSVQAAKEFQQKMLIPATKQESQKKASTTSPNSVVASAIDNSSFINDNAETVIQSQIENLSIDDNNYVAKVTPDRIYSVAAHPSKSHLLVCAGDKQGYVGMWNLNHTSDNRSANNNDGVHLFRFHTRPVNTLEWTSPQGLLSSSYDGTVRYFDIAQESFEQVFAIDDDEFSCYTQYLAVDHRSAASNQQSFFLSTSMGSVLHIDRRMGGISGTTTSSRSSSSISGAKNITFHAQLSEKKINSVSLHRDGYCLATGGLDRTVKFWDLRKFGGTRAKKVSSSSAFMAPTEPTDAFLGEHFNKLSVNSAFFSPSGDYLVTTNMANALNIYHEAHLQVSVNTKKGNTITQAIVQPKHVIRHNNNTGRWLTTFMAQWHPEHDVFCVGSMEQPRAIDIFDGGSGDHLRAVRGDALTAVASRCCFHPSSERLILVGGNSSGRVTVIQ